MLFPILYLYVLQQKYLFKILFYTNFICITFGSNLDYQKWTNPQMRRQMLFPDHLYVFTFGFHSSLWNKTRLWKKIRSFYLYSMQLFNVLKKKKNCPRKHKKPSSKVAHNRPQTFFHVLAWLPKPAQNWFTYYKYVPRRICSLFCGQI